MTSLIDAARKAYADELVRLAQRELEQRIRLKHEAQNLMREVVQLYLKNYDPTIPDPVFVGFKQHHDQLDAYFTLDSLQFKAIRWDEGQELQLLIDGDELGHEVGSLPDLGRLLSERAPIQQADTPEAIPLDTLLCKACGPGHLKHQGACGVRSDVPYPHTCVCHPDGLGTV